MVKIFENRREAGRVLVPDLGRCKLNDPIILGLPRGGIPVAYEIAAALGAPLDMIIVRKLGVPLQPELAFGAIASGGIRVINKELVRAELGLGEEAVAGIVAREEEELERRVRAYRGDAPFPDLAGRDVVIVDDGMATGATMRAAAEAVRTKEPGKIVVAVPTASRSAVDKVSAIVDKVVCLDVPASFRAVGEWYIDFTQTTDAEVRELLEMTR